MKREIPVFGFLLLLLALAVACTGNQSDEAENTSSPVPDGPALVMFYTDN